MRATSLRPAVLTIACCCGVLAGCATPHSGPVVPPAGAAIPPPAKAPAASPASASAKPDGALSFAGDGARKKVSDDDLDSGGKGVDLGLDIPNLEVLDPGLKDSLAILRIGGEPKDNRLLSVFTGMRNKTGQNLYLQVQTLYRDRAGNPLNNGTWVPMTLKPHQSTEYRSASLSVEAVDFTVRIRRGVAPNG